MKECDQSRGVAGGPGRRTALAGLALLCVSFFLPYPAIYAPLCIQGPASAEGEITVSYINYGPDVPTQDHPGMSPAMVAFGEGHAIRYFLGPGFPFILGAAGLCLYLLPHLMRADKAPRCVARAIQIAFVTLLLWTAGVICAALVRYVGILTVEAYGDGVGSDLGPDTDLVDVAPIVVLSVMIFVTGLGCAAMVFFRQDIRRAMGAFFCALISLPVFALHAFEVTDVLHFGPFVSALACVLIIVGGLWEAIAAARTAKAAALRA